MSRPIDRTTQKCAVILFSLVLFGCEAPAGSSDEGGFAESLKSAFGRTAEVLGAAVLPNYDPPDFTGPPLGELPAYFEGDAYTYSSGRTETIAAIDGEMVSWENDLKSRFERYRNFVLPTARTRTDRGEVIRRFDATPDLMWPLIPGTRRKFWSEIRVKIEGERGERLFRRDWVCTVEGRERVKVQFGEFDTVRISCDRFARGTWQQRRTWYYVPEIGHYVKRSDRYVQRDGRDIELVSIQQAHGGLSRTAKRAIYDLEQQTLERMPSGKPANWKSDNGRISVTMTVTKTLRTEAGQFCRTFRQEIDDTGVIRLVPGLACRTWNGRWVRL